MEWYPCSYSGGDWDSLLDTHGVTPDPQTFPADRGLPFAGTTPSNESFTDIYNFSENHKSGFYTVLFGNTWYDVISLRHRNGYGDGTNYGLVIYCKMNNADGDLSWGRQSGADNLETSRTLLDSKNYSSYIGSLRDKTNGNPIYLNYAASAITPDATRPWLALWINNGDNTYDLKTTNIANFIQAKYTNSYYGMVAGNYDDSSFIRTTINGIIPYQTGGLTNGHSYIGNNSWYFKEAYIQNIFTYILTVACIRGQNTGSTSSYIRVDDYNITISNDAYSGAAGIEYSCATNVNYLRPTADNNVYLGSSSRKWKVVYAATSTISTSDKREKKEVSYIGIPTAYDTSMNDETLVKFVRGLGAVIYKLKDGDSGRPHHGFIAQDIEELLQELNIKDHAGFIKSPKTEAVEIEEEVEEEYTDEVDGQVRTRTIIQKREEQREIPGEYIYGLRYEEFIADIVRFVQLQDEKIEEQDKKINSLEGRLSTLENMLNASTG